MSKPPTLMRWADVGGFVLEPPSGKKDTGWEAGEQVPAAHLNRLLNNVGEWVAYLNGIDANEIMTWASQQNFSSVVLGVGLTSNGLQAAVPRVTVEPVVAIAYTCIHKSKDVRVWIGSDSLSPLVITVNATRELSGTTQTGNWVKLTNSAQALYFRLARDRVFAGVMAPAQNTAWPDTFEDGRGTVTGWGRALDFPTDGQADTLTLSDSPLVGSQMPTTANVERKLLFSFPHATLGTLRVYYVISNSQGDAGALELAFNIKYSNTNNNWTRDVAGNSGKIILSRTRIAYLFADSTISSAFADNAFSKTPFEFRFITDLTASGDANRWFLGNGGVSFTDTTTGNNLDANPPSSSAVPGNTLHAKNIIKAWGLVSVTPGGSTIVDGYNAASATNDNTGDLVTVAFVTPMATANYAVNFSSANESGANTDIWATVSQTVNGFICRCTRVITVMNLVNRLNIGVDTSTFAFDVKARQDT